MSKIGHHNTHVHVSQSSSTPEKMPLLTKYTSTHNGNDRSTVELVDFITIVYTTIHNAVPFHGMYKEQEQYNN